jgi:hypothetical protein
MAWQTAGSGSATFLENSPVIPVLDSSPRHKSIIVAWHPHMSLMSRLIGLIWAYVQLGQ